MMQSLVSWLLRVMPYGAVTCFLATSDVILFSHYIVSRLLEVIPYGAVTGLFVTRE